MTSIPDPSFKQWAADVDRLMHEYFSINIADAGLDRSRLLAHFASDQSPADFVEWFGKKYELEGATCRHSSFRGIAW